MPKSVLATLAVAVALTACGGDDKKRNSVTGPDANCIRGTLSSGSSVTGTLASGDCAFSNVSVASGRYDGYSVSLTAGEVYQVQLNVTGANDADLYVEVATAAGAVIATGDDNLKDLNTELFFIAPQSGTFTIRAGGYEMVDLGSYRLSLRGCSATRITSTAAVTGSLSTGDCRSTFTLGADSSLADVFVVAYTGVALNLTVESSVIDPFFLVLGPAFASSETRNFAVSSSTGSPAVATLEGGKPAGDYLVILTTSKVFGSTGAYTIRRSATLAGFAARAGFESPLAIEPSLRRGGPRSKR